jgi:CRISPR type IV-associated protein Csf1
MTASELFCRQAGLNPQGAIADTVETCVMCGRLISSGEARSEFRPLTSFMDAPELCARDRSTKICGYCIHLTKIAVILKTQRVCITSKQVIPAARLAHLKWLLLNPPDPPFVLLQNQTNLSHMIWRTPLTLSQQLWYVRMGTRQLTVRLTLVEKALDRFKRIVDRIAETKARQRLRHPFNLLDFELRNLNVWRIRRDVAPWLDAGDQELIAMLRPGEYWALAILTTKQEPEDPNECRNIKLQES